MTAGIPGTGITAIFYMMLVALMPFRELYLWGRGRSAPGRWRVILVQSALAWAIIAALTVEGWLVARFLDIKPAPVGTGLLQVITHNIYAVSALVMALATFSTIVVGVQVLRVTCSRRTAAPAPLGMQAIGDDATPARVKPSAAARDEAPPEHHEVESAACELVGS